MDSAVRIALYLHNFYFKKIIVIESKYIASITFNLGSYFRMFSSYKLAIILIYNDGSSHSVISAAIV